MNHLAGRGSVALLAALFLLIQTAEAQDTLRFYRLHLRGKSQPLRYLTPTDPLYRLATAHLTQRALDRRARVLPPGRLVSTRDLPVDSTLLQRIAATGATIRQVSRWFNTVMVVADSITYAQRLRTLPFIDSVEVVRVHAPPPTSPRKPTSPRALPSAAPGIASPPGNCLTTHYGLSDYQNRFMGIEEAHRIGIAGEDVLVGLIDAGFAWRQHKAFRGSRILGEYDFIYGDSNTANELQDSAAQGSQESHGTSVLSLMAATWLDTLVGGAPRAGYYLAKTEDLRWERHVEEDNFVAGLEWLESRGVDITNTSLGYTTFTAPEAPHQYAELDGHTIIASRSVNIATELGVLCVVAAGNEGEPGKYIYVSVPAEADSALAAAAVDSLGRIGSFSSRGLPGRSLKPDVAAFGVGNWAADAGGPDRVLRSRGTSFASPVTAGIAALVLSAAPELRPWELRSLLQRTASRAANPDTAFGHGQIDAGRALALLSVSRPVVGVPAVSLSGTSLAIAAYIMSRDADDWERPAPAVMVPAVSIQVTNLRTGGTLTTSEPQLREGIARWSMPAGPEGLALATTDSVEITITGRADSRLLRRTRLRLDEDNVWNVSTLCAEPVLAQDGSADVLAWPNPTEGPTRISFWLGAATQVTLTIHNAIGEEIARLLDSQQLLDGAHAPVFDPQGLPSGAYYVLLRAGEGTRTGAFIYLP